METRYPTGTKIVAPRLRRRRLPPLSTHRAAKSWRRPPPCRSHSHPAPRRIDPTTAVPQAERHTGTAQVAGYAHGRPSRKTRPVKFPHRYHLRDAHARLATPDLRLPAQGQLIALVTQLWHVGDLHRWTDHRDQTSKGTADAVTPADQRADIVGGTSGYVIVRHRDGHVAWVLSQHVPVLVVQAALDPHAASGRIVGAVEETWSVGRVAELGGVSVRTLHYYDEIGLVRPSARTPMGYRAYTAADVERLREVLAYRRLGFGLRELAELVDDKTTNTAGHLLRLRAVLLERRDRADAMVAAIDRELEARAKGLTVTPEAQLEMLGARLYDVIGGAYPATRRTEPRIAAQILDALGDARTVLNVGAGTGSYEPSDREVTAVEPSAVMRAQRPVGAARCIAAAAENLPFQDQSFDVAMAVSTVHHWDDPMAGLREMRRVGRRVVVLTFDTDEPGWRDRFWLTRDYLPEFADVLAGFPSLAAMANEIDGRAEAVPVPWDCSDGLFEAYWRRPEAYLQDYVRRAMSVWTRVGQQAEQRAVQRLSADLDSGRWIERNRELTDLDAADLGLRLIVA